MEWEQLGGSRGALADKTRRCDEDNVMKRVRASWRFVFTFIHSGCLVEIRGLIYERNNNSKRQKLQQNKQLCNLTQLHKLIKI